MTERRKCGHPLGNERWCPECELATPAAPASAPSEGAVLDDLAHLVSKLVHSLRKAAPGHALADQAVDYLKRKGLAGSPLRATEPTLPIEIHGKLYEVPIAVQIRIVSLEEQLAAAPTAPALQKGVTDALLRLPRFRYGYKGADGEMRHLGDIPDPEGPFVRYRDLVLSLASSGKEAGE